MAHNLRPNLFVLVICLIFNLSSFNSLVSAQCYPQDRDALVDVAASLSGRVAMKWKPEQDCCHWAGVTCGPPFNSSTMTSPAGNSSAHPKLFSRVVGLKLAGIYDIDATSSMSMRLLPLAICRLSALISLNLSSNAFFGPIPTCFSHNLTSLQTLILRDNSLSSSLSPLANLSLLTHLDLSHNQFTSVQASSLIFSKGPSTNLRYLDLSNNPTNIFLTPGAFNTAPILEYLKLRGFDQKITGDIRVLEHLQHLQTLSLGMNVPAQGLRSLFCKLRSLQVLSVNNAFYIDWETVDIYSSRASGNHTTLDGMLLCEKPASVTLTFLDLSGQGYTGPFPKWIAHFVGLQSLNLIGNYLEGSIPQEWQALTQLTDLILAGHDLPATPPVSLSQEIQSWLFRLPLEHLNLMSMGLTSQDFPCAGFSLLNQTLQILDLSNNLISPGSSLLHCLLHHNFSLSTLDLSGNPLALPLQPHMFPPSTQFLELSYCQLYGSLSNIGTLPSASYIIIAHNNLTGSIPSDIGNLIYGGIFLDLSYNKLTGIIPSSIWNLTGAHEGSLELLFDNNHLHGTLARSQGLKADYVSIANNYLSKASFHNVSGLEYLDLSGNQLQGDLENLLGDYSVMKSLSLLELGNNQLTMRGPISSLAIWNLTTASTWVGLNNNHVHGELVLHDQALTASGVSIANNYLSKVYFHNVSYLAFLDLSSNQLGGTLESILGDYTVMRNLIILLLHNNQLKGSIPSSLGASAPSLITMDLSNNKLIGAIPPSLQHLRALESKTYAVLVDYIYPYTLQSVKNGVLNMQDKQIRGHLDLSSNQLNGTIPDGLGVLIVLKDLILSRNQLSGPIPPSLAHLAALETLDLSFNNLEGAIPSELSKLTYLEVFNVSFNPKLSGQIPEGTQVEAATSYEGDPKLCGQVINKSCGGKQFLGALTPQSQDPGNTLGFKHRFSSFIKWIEEWIAIPGLVIGHVVGMGITIWALKRMHFFK